MKCSQTTVSGDRCFNEAVIKDMCMKHFIKNMDKAKKK